MTKIDFIIVYILLQIGIKFKRRSMAQFNISVFEAAMLGFVFREIKSFDTFQIPFNCNFDHATSSCPKDESEEDRKCGK